MPNLGVVSVRGVNMSVQDLHELDCSPTQTPAQTRSVSPTRGSNMPHTHREAAAFISRLNDMVTTEEASHGPGTGERVEAESEKDKALPTGQSLIAATTNSDKNSLTNGIDAKKAASESSFSSPVPTRLDGLVKVNAIDGSGSVSFRSKIQILLIYFLFNLGLTLYNKAVMIMFPFPFLVTALHAASGIVGTQLLLARGSFTLKNLSRRDNAVLSAFSILYTANIAVSNVSLAMVTIPFHQTVRALTPVFTVAIYRVVFSSIYSTATYISLIPVILGVGLASYGDLNATILGSFMTLFGTLLAAIKTVTTNRLQTAGLHLSALELLHRMSPIACVQSLVVAYITGEFDHFETQLLGSKGLLILLVNGIIAFGLNVASFEANKRSGALTMTIAANVKQVLTVVLSVIIWRVPVGALNAFGIVLTLTGGAWYGRVEFMGKAAESNESRMEQGATGKA